MINFGLKTINPACGDRDTSGRKPKCDRRLSRVINQSNVNVGLMDSEAKIYQLVVLCVNAFRGGFPSIFQHCTWQSVDSLLIEELVVHVVF